MSKDNTINLLNIDFQEKLQEGLFANKGRGTGDFSYDLFTRNATAYHFFPWKKSNPNIKYTPELIQSSFQDIGIDNEEIQKNTLLLLLQGSTCSIPHALPAIISHMLGNDDIMLNGDGETLSVSVTSVPTLDNNDFNSKIDFSMDINVVDIANPKTSKNKKEDHYCF